MSDINDILRLLDREIWLVAAEHENRHGGLIATFVSHASIVPELPRMVVGIAKQHHTWGLIEASRAFTLHLLDESHLDWVWRFGLQSAHSSPRPPGEGSGVRDKFDGLQELQPVAWLSCKVETSLDTGDRTLYLAEVVAGKLEKRTPPLTMKRLLQLAPSERLRELKAGLERDAVVDAAAIRSWRT